MVIQNFDTLFLKVTPETKEIFLPKERFLADSNLSYLIPLYDNSVVSYAPDGVQLIDVTNEDNIFIDLYELGKDYKCKNICSSFLDTENRKRFLIDCILDFDLSVVKIKDTITTANKYIGLCAIYTDTSKQIETPTTNAVTLIAPAQNSGKIKLSDIGGYQMNGQLIKKIEAVNTEDCYITIRTKNNDNNINEMPLYLLDSSRQFSDNDIYFDSLWIDWDNSYITITQNKATDTVLTFKF